MENSASVPEKNTPVKSQTAAATITIMLAGGGTAGHIEPALAVADALKAYSADKDYQMRVIAIGTPKGLEKDLVPQRGYQLYFTNPIPFPRKISLELGKLPWRILRSVYTARKILRQEQVDIIIGFGGYVALSAYLAARLPKRYPIIVHEANVVPGLANKIGSLWAHRVLSSSEQVALPAQVVGTPIRAEISQLDRMADKYGARQKFRLPATGPVLLVFGGSQGAEFINTVLGIVLEDLLRAGISVIHAHGAKNNPIVLTEYQSFTGSYRPFPYITDMVSAYAASDAVLSRSGAMSVAEISAVNLPAIYIPLSHGNGEQGLNITDAVQAGAAVAVLENDIKTGKFSREDLLALIKDIIGNQERNQIMSQGSATLLHAQAATTIARIMVETYEAERKLKLRKKSHRRKFLSIRSPRIIGESDRHNQQHRESTSQFLKLDNDMTDNNQLEITMIHGSSC